MTDTGPTERTIQRAVLREMARVLPPDAFWFHVANQTIAPANYVGALKGDGLKPGVPDLILLHRSAAFGLEIKRPGESLTPEQCAIHARLEGAGCRTVVLRSADAVESVLGAWGLLDGAPAVSPLHGGLWS